MNYLSRLVSLVTLITVIVLTAIAAPTPAIAASSSSATSDSCPWVGQKGSPVKRANEVIAHMNLDDEIQLLHGAGGSAYVGHVAANPKLCIPAINLEDGPAGVADGMPGVTQLPAPVAGAATWDPVLMRQYGTVIGNEEARKGADVALAPTVNIVRDPRWGRAFETLGEDPYLTSQLADAEVRGIQSQGEMAQTKHWLIYNEETHRNTGSDNAIVDKRTLHEIYAPPFRSAIEKAHTASIMCSYSLINGPFACEDRYLLTTVLRDQLHFPGFVTADWGATHSTVLSAKAGLDMEMPDSQYFSGNLKQAVQDGRVSRKTIDSKVRHILREMFRFGLFQHPHNGDPNAVVTGPKHARVARNVAEQGTVLLKNQQHILPLNSQNIHSIAVIGPDGGTAAQTAGGGSAHVVAPYTVTPYQGIQHRASDHVQVRYTSGIGPGGGLNTVPSTVLTPPSGHGSGLLGQYYNNTGRQGKPVLTRIDRQVDFGFGANGSPGQGVHTTNFSAEWTGTLTPPKTGTYKFSLSSDDGSTLQINGQTVVDNSGNHGVQTRTGQIKLQKGQRVTITVDYHQNGGGDAMYLGWLPPNSSPLDPVRRAARNADVAVVFASYNESEGSDLQDINLSKKQNAIISAVAKANPNTIVVLNTGSAVTMPWLNQVKGVLEAWYPGQEDGNALAAILFGDTNPSGKLPVTFPRSLGQVPANTDAQWPGVNGKVHYSEGLEVGYRWYDAHKLQPLFPFGFGLSYTSFRLGDLHVAPHQLDGDGPVQVRAKITNTGQRAGADVVQLYLGHPTDSGEPPMQLKAFKKVDLAPGQSRTVKLHLNRHAFAVWDTKARAWAVRDGKYRIRVGDSSRHLPLHSSVQITRTYGPQALTIGTSHVLVGAGNTQHVHTVFQNEGDVAVHAVRLSASTPSGVSLQTPPPQTFKRVGGGQSVDTYWYWRLQPGADVKPGTYHASISARYQERGKTHTIKRRITLSVPYANISQAYNNVGVTSANAIAAGNFDGSGYSYAAQSLAAAGLKPGAKVMQNGFDFTWPDAAPGKPDNVSANGQTIPVNSSGHKLGLLGSGANADQSGTLTIHYVDGTKQTVSLGFANWYSNEALEGHTVVATGPWHLALGSNLDKNHKVSVYLASVPLSPNKMVQAITLPSNPNLHIFAFATK